MSAANILLPCAAMVGITAAVWVRLYVERVGEMRARGISSQDLATSRRTKELLQNTNSADNFRNLFEMPVLFYMLCLALTAAGLVNAFFVAGAWAFVALRAAHSFIHCSYNRVMHRFIVYALSSVLLFGMWGVFGAKLLGLS
jgi:hypothetical protein